MSSELAPLELRLRRRIDQLQDRVAALSESVAVYAVEEDERETERRRAMREVTLALALATRRAEVLERRLAVSERSLAGWRQRAVAEYRLRRLPRGLPSRIPRGAAA